jgi:hypothetical protein
VPGINDFALRKGLVYATILIDARPAAAAMSWEYAPPDCGDEDVDCGDTVAGGGGEVGADRPEFIGAGHGAHATGDLDPEFAHPDGLLSCVVGERDAQVAGEPQTVGLAAAQPRGQGVPFLLEPAAAAGVEGNPGGG